MKNKKSITSRILLILAVIVVINFVSDRFFFRLDFTADGRYTLSKASKDILGSLQEPVTITAYFTEDLPANLIKTKRDFKEMLVEYNQISHGKVIYEFIDPGTDQQIEQKAMNEGIKPILVSVREKDQVKQQKVYLGAVIQKGNNIESIPVIQPGAAMEYALSSNIKKLSVAFKPKVGFVTGHGEPGLAEYQQATPVLKILYDIEEVDMNNPGVNLDNYKTLVLVSPKDSVDQEQLQMLDEFMANGGNVLFAYDKVQPEMSKGHGSVNTNFENWLVSKGIEIGGDFIVDANCATITVPRQQGNFKFSQRVRFPYVPLINTFEDHPITEGLEEVTMPFVSAIYFTGDTSEVKFLPIARTSKVSGTQTPPFVIDVNRQWAKSDYPLSGITVGAALEGRLAGNTVSRMVVFSDGGFPVNGTGQNQQKLRPDNINLMVNAVDWLSDDTGLIELRTKGVTSRPLDQVSDGKKAFLRWLNFLLPVLLIVIYGFVRMQHNRNLRVKRMEEGYV